MGAQWKHAGRVANAAKRGAVISKLTKEIIIASKMGGPDPEGNFRLRTAMEAARKASVPRDNIERAIKKGAGLTDEPVIIETILYEGFAPHRVPVMVECLTDNKNRTASEVRVLFRKGQLGNSGAVAWMFDRRGVVEAVIQGTSTLDLESVAIEANGSDFEALENEETPAGMTGIRIFSDATDLDSCSKALSSMGWTLQKSELSYIAKDALRLDEAQKAEVIEFLQNLDDHDDVHRVFAPSF